MTRPHPNAGGFPDFQSQPWPSFKTCLPSLFVRLLASFVQNARPPNPYAPASIDDFETLPVCTFILLELGFVRSIPLPPSQARTMHNNAQPCPARLCRQHSAFSPAVRPQTGVLSAFIGVYRRPIILAALARNRQLKENHVGHR